MDIFLSILAIICVVCGVLGCIVPVLPGPPIAYVGILLAHWTKYADFSTEFLLTWGAVTVIVTILDYFLPAYMTKWFGGSKKATTGATIGIFLGMLVMPWGIILGPFLGALVGEWINNKQLDSRSFKAAMGSFFAFIFGTGAKLAVSVIMAVYVFKGIFA